MNKNDVFQKSELGRAEIQNQHSNLLLREARTLLIFIDGQKTYQQYTQLLDKGKMFADTGGIAPYFELLIDLGFVELITSGNVDVKEESHDTLDLSVFETKDEAQTDAASFAPISEAAPAPDVSVPVNTDTPVDSDFDSFFNQQPAESSRNDDVSIKRKDVDLNFESVKSKLATYIEQRAPAQDVWSHMLNLEQCDNAAALIVFIKDIERNDNGDLSQNIGEFSKMLEQ